MQPPETFPLTSETTCSTVLPMDDNQDSFEWICKNSEIQDKENPEIIKIISLVKVSDESVIIFDPKSRKTEIISIEEVKEFWIPTGKQKHINRY